jgi:hypothetical protein
LGSPASISRWSVQDRADRAKKCAQFKRLGEERGFGQQAGLVGCVPRKARDDEHPRAGGGGKNVLSKGGSAGRGKPGINDQQVDGPRAVLAQQQTFGVARCRQCRVAGKAQDGRQGTPHAVFVVGHEDGFPAARGCNGRQFTFGHEMSPADRQVATGPAGGLPIPSSRTHAAVVF